MANAFLPGIDVVLNDLGLKVAPPPAGPKVTLLGITSNTGVPLRDPFTVGSVEKAMNTLYFSGTGTNVIPGELARAIEQSVNGGATNLEVVVIGHYTGQDLFNYIDPTGAMSGRYADLSGAYDVLRHRELDVVVPVGVYADATGSAAGKNLGKQLADFCFQATTESNAAVGVISVAPVLEWAYMHRDNLKLAWNQDVVSGQAKNSSLSGEIEALFPAGNSLKARQNYLFATPSSDLVNEWTRYHTLAPSGQFKSWVWGVSNYQTDYYNWLFGAFGSDGVKKSASAGSVHQNYFTSWQAKDSDGSVAVDGRGVKVDAGGYITMFAAPVLVAGTQVRSLQSSIGLTPSATTFNADGSAAYAGLINSLAAQSSTTNKFINGLTPQRLLSATQANDMSGMRFATMYQRSKGFVVAAGNTAAYNVNNSVRSDFVNLTTMRIAQAAVDLVRSVAEKYLGEPNSAPRMNALDSEIGQVLQNMQGQGALNGKDYVIQSTPDQRVLGELDINLTLVPAFEIRDINLTVSLSKEL